MGASASQAASTLLSSGLVPSVQAADPDANNNAPAGGDVVVIPVDASEHSEVAFNCEFIFMTRVSFTID